MMKVIVTGATSFLGSHTVAALREAGMEVFAFRHSFEEEPLLPESADVWIHYAWAGKGSEGRMNGKIQADNVSMSMAALKKACELKVKKFLFAGSQAEYSLQSAYGRAKKDFGQRAFRYLSESASSVDFIHMRIFSVYGPGDHENSLVSMLIKSAVSGNDMDLGPCTQLWNYTYIDDVVRAIKLLISAGDVKGTVDIAGTDTRLLKDYVEEAWKVLSARGKLNFGARGNNAEGSADLIPHTDELKKLGFEAKVTFADGIKLTLGESQ